MFKEQYGVSINTYVLNLRITKAKQMLRFTDKNWKILTTNVALGHHTISAAFLNRLRALRLQSSVKVGVGRKIADRELDGKREKCSKAEKIEGERKRT